MWSARLLLAASLVLTSVTANAAPVPKDLSMRKASAATQARTSKRWIVAQATPAPAQPAPAPAQPAPTPPVETPPAEPAPPAEPVPEATTPPPAEPAPEAAPPAEAVDETAAEDEEDLEGSTEEVFIVTGSLIERKELTTASPVTVVSHEDLQNSGKVSVGDVLQNLPAQSNGINTNVNNGGDGSTRVDLRGLGSNRTLVLINGRRVVPGGLGADSSVDLNAIPLAMIDHVEVLKDGASAIYGSDAVGGVVNIITRNDYSGQEASGYTGTSQRGDGVVYDLSFVTGNTTKKSNVVFSAGISKMTKVMAGDRDWSATDHDFDYDAKEVYPLGSTTVPGGFLNIDEDNDGIPDPGNQTYQDEVLANCNKVTGQRPDGSNILAPCTRDPVTGKWRPFVGSGDPNDTYNFQPENYLVTPQTRYNVYSSGSYNFTERTRAFYEGMYLNRDSNRQLAPEPLVLQGIGGVISADSIYNPYGKDIEVYKRRLLEVGDRAQSENVNMFRIVAGFDGQLPDSLPIFNNGSWELSYNYGRTNAQIINRGNLIASHVANAIGPSYYDDPVAKTGAHCGTMAEPGPEDCVPLDLLSGAQGDTRTISPAMAKYLTYTGISSGYNEQQGVLGTIRGPLAKTPWGGFIAMGLGGSFRNEAGGSTPDPLTSTGDTTGNASEPTDGSFHVFEEFAELAIVPIVGQDFLKWAEINLAARAVEYSNFGNEATWKAGGLFRFKGGIALRGTYSTAFRAPAINELFSGNADNYETLRDPCATAVAGSPEDMQCTKENASRSDPSTQLRAVVGGNEDLNPETAKVFTTGVVWEAPMVEGLAITLDYFHFTIDDAIQTIGGDVILANCYSDPAHTNCDKIHRFDNGIIDFIDDKVTNVGGNETSGLDFAVSYEHATANAGRFRGQVEGSFLFKYIETNAEGVDREGRGVYDLGVRPDVKANLLLMWGMGHFGVGSNVRYIGEYKECPDNNCNNDDSVSRTVDATVTGDLFANYDFKSSAGKTMISGGVNNVLDVTPPAIYSQAPDADTSAYDFLGRYFYVRLTQAF
jgi:outer membrane receptor protein involved in Fe transport